MQDLSQAKRSHHTDYSQFYLTRRGRHVLRQCDGVACHVRGFAKIIEK
ncbi:MAG: NAD(P)H-dependent oxidoreductase subunit E [Desulfobacterales bacterium]|nr:MAG: NAD(P)H-dependent oxidoreductase subunit E [Desulfobacterales bacterium]